MVISLVGMLLVRMQNIVDVGGFFIVLSSFVVVGGWSRWNLLRIIILWCFLIGVNEVRCTILLVCLVEIAALTCSTSRMLGCLLVSVRW